MGKRKATAAKTLRQLVDELPPPRLVKDWLYDYCSMIQGTRMEEVLGDVLTREVSSYAEARSHVDSRISMMITWLDGTRPSPSPVYEHEAWKQWIEERKAKSVERENSKNS